MSAGAGSDKVLRVLLTVAPDKDHSLYRELLGAPPDGIEYVHDGQSGECAPSAPRKEGLGAKLRRNALVRAISDPVFVGALPGEDGSRSRIKMALACSLRRLGGAGKDRTGIDLVHSAGSSMLENIPWIVRQDMMWVADFESAASLFGYYGDWRRRIYRDSARRLLEKQLSSRYCRKLMPWTDASRKTLEHLVPSKAVQDKVEVVRLAVRPAPPRPANIPSHDAVRVLFIGSSNFRGEFYSKGGLEVLEVYKRLRATYGEKVELIFRCWMPEELRPAYGSLEGVKVITDVLPRDEFDMLFWTSDIFLFPAHNTPGMAFLEAMRFGLPVVSKDIWANSELVRDGETGFLVPPSEKIPYYLPGFVPNWSMDDGPFIEHMKSLDGRVVDDLVERVSRLVDSRALRERMGAAGRRVVEEGHASIGRRNAQLKRIYEESARR